MRFLGRRRGATSSVGILAQLTTAADPAVRFLFSEPSAVRVVIDRTGVVVRVGEHGTLRADLPAVGQPVVGVFARDARAATWQAIEHAMAQGVTVSGPVPAPYLTMDGVTRDANLWISPVLEPDRRCAGALLTLTDASAQRAAEAELVRSRKLQAIGALAGGIAHDFNNLLQAISAAAEALAEHDPNAREEIAQISAATARGGGLVRQLLAFARQQTLQPQVVAVNSALSGIAGLLRHSLGGGIRLDLVLATPGRSVLVDPGQLDQVLVNLAVNARNAMPSGGLLTLRSGHCTVLSTRIGGIDPIPPGRYVTIEAIDTGHGIAPEVLPRIFDPFFSTGAERGTGLGLSSVLGILRQSGGFIEVESTPGQGTTMRLLLPRCDATAPKAETPVPESPAPGRQVGSTARAGAGRAVLLVEDEEPIRRLAGRALERHGWKVLAAEDGEAALRIVEGAAGVAAPQLAAVISDMVMPGMDGASLVKAIRARTGRPDLPAIIVSGFAEERLRASIGAAATAYLAKPYGMAALAELLASLTAAVPDPQQ